MVRGRRCAACKAPVPTAAAYCPGCGRYVAPDEEAASIDFDVSAPNSREQPRADAVVRVGARERTRTQLFAIGGVLLVLLIVAVLVGRGRSKPAASPKTTVSPSTTAFPTTAPPPTTTPDSTAVPTTAPFVATTTTVGQVTPVTNVPTTVLAMTQSGTILQIDLVSGLVLPVFETGFHPARSLLAVKDGVFMLGENGLFFASWPNGTTPVSVPGNNDYVLGTPDGVGILVVTNDGTAQQVTYIGSDLIPRSSVAIPTGYPVGLVDGGILVQTNGLGTYRFDLKTGSASRVLAGAHVASLHTQVAGIVCDGSLSCELQVTTGGRVKYHLPLPPGMSLNQFGGGAFSPDGTRLAYLGVDERGTIVGIVDLATGQVITTTAPDADSVVWTPSSQGVIWRVGGDLWFWSGRGSDGQQQLAFPRDPISAFSVAP